MISSLFEREIVEAQHTTWGFMLLGLDQQPSAKSKASL